MAFRFTENSFTFGPYSRYLARECVTRFGVVEWQVTDAEEEDLETGLPAVVGQFLTRSELDEFVQKVVDETTE